MDDSSRLAALEIAVAELRAQLEAARPGRVHSMAHTHRCPACGGGSLLHFPRVRKGVGAKSGWNDFAFQMQASRLGNFKLAAGVLEAYACRTCRLVEWHALSLDDVVVDGKDVLELEAPADAPPSGVYR